MFTLGLLFGVVVGALATIIAQALALYILFNRFFKPPNSSKRASSSPLLDPPLQCLPPNNQGTVWVLEPDKIPKPRSEDHKNNKKEIYQVSPVKKIATIKDHSLILLDSDGSQETINLLDCTVLSVSASDLPSRKWAKKYPIKVESRNTVFCNGSKTCYLYLDTSWEKDSWCKALRLSSCINKERLNWHYRLREEFHSYLTSLNAGYTSFLKPSVCLSSELSDKGSRIDCSSSKVRHFLKKLAKKASKTGLEYKDSGSSSLACEERKMSEKLHSTPDLLSVSGSRKVSLTVDTNKSLNEDPAEPSSTSKSGSVRHPAFSDIDCDEKPITDEGTLCFNLLTSRLFFDVKRCEQIKSSIIARIQHCAMSRKLELWCDVDDDAIVCKFSIRTLSSMRTPSYIGGVTCVNLDIGNLPPYIHSMRALPMDLNEVWAMDFDIEYAGGAILDIETRIEIREPELQKSMDDGNSESSSVEDDTSDLLEVEDFEYLGEQLTLHGGANDEVSKMGGADKLNVMKSLKSSNWKSVYASRWKAIISSMANHVSQVPLSLKIKIASVRGTVQLQIKPPPSDQLWFTFTSMPEIDFNLESSVGEHRITSGHVALLLGNRIKAAIRETLVLPNCESVSIPWMLAERDDWVPRKVAPYMRASQEADNDIKIQDFSFSHSGEAKPILEVGRSEQCPGYDPGNIQQKTNNMAATQQSINGFVESESSSQSNPVKYLDGQSLQDLKTPLLSSDVPHEIDNSGKPESPYGQPSSEMPALRQISLDEDANPKRVGRRARMMDLGKKMGEKLEERRRHIEERGRHIVEKMRGS
ncbi:hypothetical protein Sjap_014416 [Stephania japonica]|uniref:SMP-LTD domain-containing protein n=1 Tax=Stephania japonica TaxID=461633 RepID=A0AAP0IH64_9MAGN